jgi:secreted trypsin-like serine protease
MTSRRRSSIGSIAGLLACALLGCGSAHEQVGQTDQSITHGVATDADPAVVGLVYPLQTKQVIGCTGSLVAPARVLTAAHCVDPLAPDSVLFGSNLAEGESIAVAGIDIHPEFDASSLNADLALLSLGAPASVEPLDIRHALDVAPEPGSTVRLVGFGRTESASPPRKRTGHARIASVSTDQLGLEPAPSLSCSGDSGGPAFLLAGDAELVVGVASKGDWECAARATYTRAGVAADFLAQIGSDGSEPGGCSVRRSTGSNASFWAGLGLLVVGLARSRPRTAAGRRR